MNLGYEFNFSWPRLNSPNKLVWEFWPCLFSGLWTFNFIQMNKSLWVLSVWVFQTPKPVPEPETHFKVLAALKHCFDSCWASFKSVPVHLHTALWISVSFSSLGSTYTVWQWGQFSYMANWISLFSQWWSLIKSFSILPEGSMEF